MKKQKEIDNKSTPFVLLPNKYFCLFNYSDLEIKITCNEQVIFTCYFIDSLLIIRSFIYDSRNKNSLPK